MTDVQQRSPLTEPELFRGYGALDPDPDAAGWRCPMCGNPTEEAVPEYADEEQPCGTCLRDMRDSWREAMPMP